MELMAAEAAADSTPSVTAAMEVLILFGLILLALLMVLVRVVVAAILALSLVAAVTQVAPVEVAVAH
jgi:hypothetical protein